MAESVLNQTEQKVDSAIDNRNQKTSLKRVMGIILSIVMIGLSVYVYNLMKDQTDVLNRSSDLALSAGSVQSANYRSYVKQYKDTKAQLEETTRKLEEVNRQLDEVTSQLSTTKGMLTETQQMLNQAQTENQKLKEDLQGIAGSDNLKDLETNISSLKERNKQVTDQLSNLKSELRAFEGEFASVQEGLSLISLFQNKIKLVKSRLSYLKQEAYFAKIAAQKEHDRISALNGNNGFIVRNGQAHKPGEKGYSIDVNIVP